MAEIPHFKHPFQRGISGRVQVDEQDTPEHVLSCEARIVLCPTGFRRERPEFGWPWPEFAPAPIDLGPLENALRQFEPRGDARAEEWADTVDASTRSIKVHVEGGEASS